MTPRRSKLVVAAAVVAVVTAVAATVLYFDRQRTSPVATLPTGFERLGLGAEDVVLQHAGGRAARWGEFAGRPRALFFGFTHCPDICPTTIMELDAARRRLGGRARRLQIDFVTIDPERDTPARLAQYVSSFDGVRAFAGDADSTSRIATAYRASYARRGAEGAADYTMDHTASVYLIDAKGQVVDQIAFGSAAEVFDQKIARLLAKS